jgi:hypothetical protein
MIERVGVRGSLYPAMRYKTLEEVAGKYGLTVDLDEKAQLSEWESRLKNLLESKQKGLPNARNPSLRHKVERECAEVQEAFKFVSQQNFFTKLRRCVDEDKREIFEHELRKPESRSILPSENDPEYDQFLELKVAARKKWSSNPVPTAAANSTNPSPLTSSPSNGESEKTASVPVSLVSPAAAAHIAEPRLCATEHGRGISDAATPASAVPEPSNPVMVKSAEVPTAASTPEPITLAARTGLPALTSDLSKKEVRTLPLTFESALPSVTLTTATGGSAEKVTEQLATTLSQTAPTIPATTAQAVNEQQTETTTSHAIAGRPRPRLPIKREHVSAALDVLVKIRALTGLGGSFTALKVVATALAVFLIALAGLITQLTRERSRQNQRVDNTQIMPTHQESRVIPSASPSPEPSKQPSESAKPSAESSTAPFESVQPSSESATAHSQSVKPPSETPKTLSTSSNPPAEFPRQSSDVAKHSSEMVKQPEAATQPSEPVRQPPDVVKQASEPLNQPSEVAKQSTESTEPQKQPSEVAKASTEPPKQASDLPKQSTEPPRQPSGVSLPPSEIVKQVSELAKQISEVAKAPVETSTQVSIAKPKESPPPEPQPETKTPPPHKPKIQLALLRIESTPPDATITIRGTKQPLKTPAEFNLMPGDYDVALALDCFIPVSTTLHLDGGENRVLTRQLQSLQPALTVRTLPPGAKIYVDGALRNQLTPATITGIVPGDRWVTVELAGYRSQNMAVKAKCGETVPVDFGILQRPTARVSITSNARGSSVWLDGLDSGQTTPCSIELPLGTHRIRLVGPQGYRPEEKSFYLQDEESVRLDVPLTPELVAIPAYNPNPARPDPPQEYIPKANPNLLVWCGLDYSMVKMIGSSRDFPESEIFPNPADRRGDRAQPMTSAWNELFMKEMYPRLGRELGAIVHADLRAVESRNARLTSQQIVHEEGSPRNIGNMADLGTFFDPARFLHRGNKNLPTHISDADIAAAIRSYRLQTRSGLGLVFIMDRLVKRQETSCMYVVFFDIASRTIISQERVSTDAGGGGIRNHWFGSIKEAVKRLPDMYHDAKLKR